MDTKKRTLRADGLQIVRGAIRAVLPDEVVSRALENRRFPCRVVLVAAGKAAWQTVRAVYDCLGDRIGAGVVITKYGHGMGPHRQLYLL